jgi:hypothetical protein
VIASRIRRAVGRLIRWWKREAAPPQLTAPDARELMSRAERDAFYARFAGARSDPFWRRS